MAGKSFKDEHPLGELQDCMLEKIVGTTHVLRNKKRESLGNMLSDWGCGYNDGLFLGIIILFFLSPLLVFLLLQL
jgi:hypothetical protein